MSREQCGEYEYQCLRVLKVKSQMGQGEHTQFHNTHTTQPPFPSFKTEIITCIQAFKWDAAGITILRGNGGILLPKIMKKNMKLLWNTLVYK